MPKSTATNVGMKKSIAKRVTQETLDHNATEIGEIQIPRQQRRTVVERRPVDPFHRQHVAGRQIPIHHRHSEIRIVPGILSHLGQGRRLEPQVHLERNRTGEGVDHFDKPQTPRLRRHELGIAGHEVECRKVDLEAPFDTGPQHLDGDRAPPRRRFDFGAMHLGDGGGRDWRAERDEHVGELFVQRRRDGIFRLSLRKRQHPVLQAFEVPGERGTDHVRPRRQELAELHISGAERRDGGRQPVLRIGGRMPLDEPPKTPYQPQLRRQRRGIDKSEYALAGAHKADAAEAEQVGESRNHGVRRLTAASRNAAQPHRRSARGSSPGGIPPP